MKSVDQIQNAINNLGGWHKNPQSLDLITSSEAFRAQMPGMIAVLRWVLDDSHAAFVQMVTDACEGARKPAGQGGRKGAGAAAAS